MIKYSSEDPTVAPRNMPTDKQLSDPRSQTSSDLDALKQVIQEAQVSLKRNFTLFILHIILSPSSRQRATRTLRQGILRISPIKVHTVYYETWDLFSSTKLRIYDKEKRDQEKVIPPYKSAMDLNKFLSETAELKICHSCVYVQSLYQKVLPVRDKGNASNQCFQYHSFENIVTAGKPLRVPLLVLVLI